MGTLILEGIEFGLAGVAGPCGQRSVRTALELLGVVKGFER